MKKQILFVDDDPLVLQGLQRQLRPLRDQWEMEFVDSGTKALERLSAVSCDVIVSDVMMPGMNGVQLLERVREVSPKTVRLVLSGHAEHQLATKCIGVAHQFLSKPCDAANLRDTITRVTDLGFAMQSEVLLKIVGRLERLPSLPETYLKLVACLDDPNASIDDMGALIERDIALSAHLLKVVNSSFFGLAQRVNKPAEAVSYLGLETLKAVVLTLGLFSQANINPATGFSIAIASQQGQMVAAAARVIAETEHASRSLANECFIAGLLHGVGRLILACGLPEQFARLTAAERGELQATESEILGTTQAEVSGYLLGLWGLLHPVVEAIRLHHSPGQSPVREFTALTALHVAEYLVSGAAIDPRGAGHALDEAYLASLNLSDRVPVWRAEIQKVLPALP